VRHVIVSGGARFHVTGLGHEFIDEVVEVVEGDAPGKSFESIVGR